MTPKKYVKFTFRDAKGDILPTPPEFKMLAEAWNSQDGVSDVCDVCEEIPVLVIDEWEDVDERIDDDSDDPRGDEQP